MSNTIGFTAIRLTEFAELCEIPISEVLRLIETGVIKLVNLETPPVMIDMSQFKIGDLIKDDLKNLLKVKKEKEMQLTTKEIEFFSAKMITSLEEITREAFELAEKLNK